MSNKMDILNYCWDFAKGRGSEYLDCEIETASGRLLTNKCFLVLSRLIWKCMDSRVGEHCKILMPSFNQNEIQNELCGFVVTCGQTLDPLEFSCSPETPIFRNRESEPSLGPVQEEPYQRKINNFQCEHCGKVFACSKKCRQHRYQVHKPANSHCCHVCGARFKTKSILSNHFKTHNSPSFSCDLCSKVSLLPSIIL